MTSQATNSLQLYYGANPETIKVALKMQKPSVVEELKAHFDEYDINKLAIRLSKGK